MGRLGKKRDAKIRVQQAYRRRLAGEVAAPPPAKTSEEIRATLLRLQLPFRARFEDLFGANCPELLDQLDHMLLEGAGYEDLLFDAYTRALATDVDIAALPTLVLDPPPQALPSGRRRPHPRGRGYIVRRIATQLFRRLQREAGEDELERHPTADVNPPASSTGDFASEAAAESHCVGQASKRARIDPALQIVGTSSGSSQDPFCSAEDLGGN